MSFQEKSNLVMTVIMVLVFGGYFGDLGVAVIRGEAEPSQLGMPFIGLTAAIIFYSIIAHIIVAVWSPDEAEDADERDKFIEMRADARSGYVLGAGAILALNLAWLGFDVYWVAHMVLAGLAGAEIFKGVQRAIDYRVGV
ncbi:hypothetical protein ABWI01_12285 [Oceanicaulis alexandrii]|uniref:hypothetical protein n=1 Tax=Oceanicaulis TaxID=153232 RepID=UPI0035CEF4B3